MKEDTAQKKMRYYDPKDRKLIYIGSEATPEMWHDRWQLHEHNLKVKLAKKDKRVIKITSRYLRPQDGVVLEGGCGYGRKVNSLTRAGYKVIGVDFDPQTVSFLNMNAPNLDIRLGDVRNLPLEDSSVAGYWSLGVIEHFYDGFVDIAQEMLRVIKPGGYLFLTHPYMSPLRKAKARLNLYPPFSGQEKPKDFYQFALDHRSVDAYFQSLGFNLCLFKMRAGLQGFNEEIPFGPMHAIASYRGNSKVVKGVIYLLNKTFTPFASHSCLMVFRLPKLSKVG